jgi:hypothetical protein
MYSSTLSIALVVSVTAQLHLPGERTGAHSTGTWVGPKTGLDVCGKSHPYRNLVL